MITTKNKVLKLSTCGSVDDGKSTLIGRLLYDTNSLKADKLEAIERNSRQRGYDYLDFSLATDGLVAEREQGITIDVAHIYFSTPQRSYIIADTPGHVEYTRNMVTGTSTSQVAIILIDARHGVVEQTRRHFYINQLLRTQHVIVAVNKMDLVNYSQEQFTTIVDDFKALIEGSDFPEQTVDFIPVSALFGDNVVEQSKAMSWYKGASLLDYLETVENDFIEDNAAARFQVQTVIRPKTEAYHDYRGYAGKLKGGNLRVGDQVVVLPSGTHSKVKQLSFFDTDYQEASAGSSITLTLEDDIQVSRGDIIVKADELPEETKQIKAKICWMDKRPLEAAKFYQLQHGIKRVKTKVKAINAQISINNLGQHQPAETLKMNDLGEVVLQTSQPLFVDTFTRHKANGSFILIDPQTHMTAGVGVIS